MLRYDSNLLERMRAGDEGAFKECVRAYSPRLLAVARRILGNEEEAQDALQDGFLSAFKNIGTFEGRAELGTWLHRIIVNAALIRLRRRRRHPERSIEDLLPHFGEGEHQLIPPVPWKDTPGTLVSRDETRDLVRRCIDQLPESYRTVLMCRDIERMDTEETARMLDISQGVVKTRLHRARQALRTLLDPHWRREDL
jgi:RNA polymerase sigma-70 factor (ECF subfamily)